MITNEEAHQKARRHADMVAPSPALDKIAAGGRGAMISGFAALAFALFAGLDVDDFPGAFALTILAGFGVPYLHYWRKEHQHAKAYAAEFTRLVPFRTTDDGGAA